MTRSLANSSSAWFSANGVRPDAAAVLFCLPYAGGGASGFRNWRSVASSSVDVQAVQLPGRESRLGEPPRVEPVDIAEALIDRIDRPYAIYGHSMGARIGFEVIRELRRRRAPMPSTFYVGAARPPDLVEPIARIGRGSDEELVRGLIELGGTPPGLLDIPELRELLLPVLRADFQWIDSYRFQPEPPLPVPVVAIAGQADPFVPPGRMLDWQRHTSDSFRLHTLPGDHFFLHDQAHEIVRLIAADLTGEATVPGRPTGPAPDEVHVWQAMLDELPGLCAATGELSSTELGQAERLRRDLDRERYVGRQVVLRRLLRHYGVEYGTENAAGRGPQSDPIRYHLSHSAGLVLLGITAGREIGVAVERIPPTADPTAFWQSALDGDEQAELVALPDSERMAAVRRIWTAKQAVCNATGDGLRIEPNQFGLARQQEGGAWQLRVPPGLQRLTQWRVTDIALDGAVGAVAYQGDLRLRFETLAPDSTAIQA